MAGPNVALLGSATVFDAVSGFGVPPHFAGLMIFGAFAILVVGLMIWFLGTELGQAILATGDNPQMITSLGVNTRTIIILGVGLSNALITPNLKKRLIQR
jgi:putative ABC transport system permease protein